MTAAMATTFQSTKNSHDKTSKHEQDGKVVQEEEEKKGQEEEDENLATTITTNMITTTNNNRNGFVDVANNSNLATTEEQSAFPPEILQAGNECSDTLPTNRNQIAAKTISTPLTDSKRTNNNNADGKPAAVIISSVESTIKSEQQSKAQSQSLSQRNQQHQQQKSDRGSSTSTMYRLQQQQLSPYRNNTNTIKMTTRIVHNIFGPSVGICYGDFSCQYNHTRGRMYVSTEAVLFYSNLFGFERRLCLRYGNVKQTQLHRSTSIQVILANNKATTNTTKKSNKATGQQRLNHNKNEIQNASMSSSSLSSLTKPTKTQAFSAGVTTKIQQLQLQDEEESGQGQNKNQNLVEDEEKHVFRNFRNREEVIELIKNLWDYQSNENNGPERFKSSNDSGSKIKPVKQQNHFKLEDVGEKKYLLVKDIESNASSPSRLLGSVGVFSNKSETIASSVRSTDYDGLPFIPARENVERIQTIRKRRTNGGQRSNNITSDDSSINDSNGEDDNYNIDDVNPKIASLANSLSSPFIESPYHHQTKVSNPIYDDGGDQLFDFESDSDCISKNRLLWKNAKKALLSSKKLKMIPVDRIVLPCSLDHFFHLFLDNNAAYSIDKYHETSIGDKNISITNWEKKDVNSKEEEELGGNDASDRILENSCTRTIQFDHAMNKSMIAIGGFVPPFTKVTKKQRLIKYNGNGMYLESTNVVEGMRFADSFQVQDQWIIEQQQVSTKGIEVVVSVYVDVIFTKWTAFKPLIQKSALAETKSWWLGYMNSIRDALEIIEKKEGAASSSYNNVNINNNRVKNEKEEEHTVNKGIHEQQRRQQRLYRKFTSYDDHKETENHENQTDILTHPQVEKKISTLASRTPTRKKQPFLDIILKQKQGFIPFYLSSFALNTIVVFMIFGILLLVTILFFILFDRISELKAVVVILKEEIYKLKEDKHHYVSLLMQLQQRCNEGSDHNSCIGKQECAATPALFSKRMEL